MKLTFIPFAPGDVVGDPEMGGWRPVPRRLFQKPDYFTTTPVTMSLERAVQLINFECHFLRIYRAVLKINFDLLQKHNAQLKEGIMLTNNKLNN